MPNTESSRQSESAQQPFARNAALTLIVVCALCAASWPLPSRASAPAAALGNRHVLHISVDGLGSHWLAALSNAGALPTFARLQREGAWTHNARTDTDSTLTLPNHLSMLTGRPVGDKFGVSGSGHRWTADTTQPVGTSLHQNAGYYLASTFDIAHDHGLSTALYASRERLSVINHSYGAAEGAPDFVSEDNGPQKIDAYTNFDLNSSSMLEVLLADMAAVPARYAFVQFDNADSSGRAHGWGSAQYNRALTDVDGYLARILDAIAASPTLRDNTWIVLTSDHGGTGTGNSATGNALNYTVPLIVWGPGIPANADLYALNAPQAASPGQAQPPYATAPGQPIRNGDSGNCAMRLLGLPAIAGTRLNALLSPCNGLARNAVAATPIAAPTIAWHASWRYSDNDSDQGATWRYITYDDSSLPSGAAPLGFGDPVSTTLSAGVACARAMTSYFRHSFWLARPNDYSHAYLTVRGDDGYAAFVNGIEVARVNLPAGQISHATPALVNIGGADEAAVTTFSLPVGHLSAGANVVAIEVHQSDACSSDLVIDPVLSLAAKSAAPQATATPQANAAQTATPAAAPATPMRLINPLYSALLPLTVK
jgi:Type I phosphodiesterase / nucleotide pyrophosphatase